MPLVETLVAKTDSGPSRKRNLKVTIRLDERTGRVKRDDYWKILRNDHLKLSRMIVKLK